MKKIEIVKDYLRSAKLGDLAHEIGLLLDNNYGSEIQELYALVELPKSEYSEDCPWRKMSLAEARQLKWKYIESALATIERFVLWHKDLEVSQATIKKAMAEIGFYESFNNYFLDECLNGESENIDVLRRVLIK